MWRWDQGEPFGNVPNSNPSGAGAFDFPLRFPGQYFDRETNNHYNMARDYSPAIGRYIQFDQIGLRGGINGFAYVGLTPIMYSDVSGLAPGDMFDTESAAARDAQEYVRRIPRSRHVEFSTVIYQPQSCKYSYTDPVTQGWPHSVIPDTSGVPSGADVTADYHNHIDRKPGEIRYVPGLGRIQMLGDPNQFSLGDIEAYDQFGINGYMGGPNGQLNVYYPKKPRPRNCPCPTN